MKAPRLSLLLCLTAACSGTPAEPKAADAPDAGTAYGPLEHGADYATGYTKLNTEPYPSEDHGGRLVNTWINSVGLAAYFKNDGPYPEGTVIVKESFEKGEGDVRGPIFVMRKLAVGAAPTEGDWWWALHWEKPAGKFEQTLGGPTYWRSPSAKVGYCWKCHVGWKDDNDWVGRVPADKAIAPPEGVEVPAEKSSDFGAEEVDEDF